MAQGFVAVLLHGSAALTAVTAVSGVGGDPFPALKQWSGVSACCLVVSSCGVVTKREGAREREREGGSERERERSSDRERYSIPRGSGSAVVGRLRLHCLDRAARTEAWELCGGGGFFLLCSAGGV